MVSQAENERTSGPGKTRREQETAGAPEIWHKVARDLRRRVTTDDYNRYISDLRFVAEVEGEVVIATRTRYTFDRVGSEHTRLIQRIWRAHDAKQRRLRLACWATEAPVLQDLVGDPWAQDPGTEADGAAASAMPADTGAGEAQAAGVSPDRLHETFDTLVTGPSNEAAVRIMRHIAAGEPIMGGLVLLHGKQGTGKTHLLSAAQQAIVSDGSGRRVVYMTAEMFSSEYVDGAMARDTRALKAHVRSGDILLIDDLQWIAKRPKSEAEFFANIRAVRTNGGTVVLTADAGAGELKGLSTSLQGELRGATTAEVGLPDDAMRLEIVRTHAQLLQAKQPAFIVDEELAAWICRRVRGPGRELCGVLWSLYAEACIGSREPQAPDMKMLEAVVRRQQGEMKAPTLEVVKKAAMRVFGVSKSELESPSKAQNLVYPRQIAMYLCRDMTTKSYPQIGNAFGGRDHATIIHAVRKIAKLLGTHPDVADHVERVRDAVYDLQASQ